MGTARVVPPGEAWPRDPSSSPGRARRIGPDVSATLARLASTPERADSLVHVEALPERSAQVADWPAWAPRGLIGRWRARGVERPWSHQRRAADLAWSGRSVAVATGTASGKSLAYLLPSLTAILEGQTARDGRGATALYIAPTKALAADQRRSLAQLDPPARIGTYDGDTPFEERDWVRRFATYVLTNPDMLHAGILPSHARWAGFLRALRFVVLDEAHVYRGVFGAHVAQVIRRLRRVCSSYGSDPVFMLASATAAQPARTAERLTGVPVEAVVEDGSPRGARMVALWEPPTTPGAGEHGAPVRRAATTETADLLTDLVIDGVQTVAFVRSRRAAESVAATVRDQLAEIDDGLADHVAAYRGGYLPEERRALESAIADRRLLAVASTNALELGVDISGLDAVLMAGYPGTRASFWQQVGRAGRAGDGALAVLVARDDPLDAYLVHHPDALFGPPVEATVFDPDNPHVLAPHLAAAAAELPLRDEDLDLFGPGAASAVDQLVSAGLLRRRPTGWYWTNRDRPSDLADLRGSGGPPVRVVESSTGRLLGTVDAHSAPRSVHDGAVYVHQGATYLVTELDLVESAAVVEAARPDYITVARETSELRVRALLDRATWDGATVHLGEVEVTARVVSFVRRRLSTGEFLGEIPLDLPARNLRTLAVWWTLSPAVVASAGVSGLRLGGALHAAEHAAIGLLPLFATCDRWDIGGLSHPAHPETELPTIFVYDGHEGGAGFAERGFRAAADWLTATRDLVSECGCPEGCPACVQSPKCGNGNAPLDKNGARRLLDRILGGRTAR